MAEHPSFVEERRAICAACPSKNPIGLCNECGCVVFLKTMIRGLDCPLGKWEKIVELP